MLKKLQNIVKYLLASLGILLAFSVYQHFTDIKSLDIHYQAVGLGNWGRILVGILQMIASFGLIFFPLQRITTGIFSMIMLGIVVYSFFHSKIYFPIEALLLGIFSLFSCIILSLKNNISKNKYLVLINLNETL